MPIRSKEWDTVKCSYCEEFLDWRGSSNNKKNFKQKETNSGWKLRRFLVVLYFLITIPIISFIVFFIIQDREIYYRWFYFYNYFQIILYILLTILLYIILSDLFKRIFFIHFEWGF